VIQIGPAVMTAVALGMMLIMLPGDGGAGPRGTDTGSSSARTARSGAHHSVRVSQNDAPLEAARPTETATAEKETTLNLPIIFNSWSPG
jgi:hypothetical protein